MVAATRKKQAATATTDSSNNNNNELPSEKERCAFLMCLTMIVATSYDYDFTVESTKAGDGIGGNGGFFRKESGMSDTTTPSDKEPGLQQQQQAEDDDDMRRRHEVSLAQQRYFQRRFQVAQDLIQTSVRHLMVDTDYENVLLPLLTPLLEPHMYYGSGGSGGCSKVVSSLTEILDTTNNISGNNQNQQALQSLDWVEENPLLEDSLAQLSSKVANHCLIWLLFHHLLSAKTGYDARVRFWFKRLAITLWIQVSDNNDVIGNVNDKKNASASAAVNHNNNNNTSLSARVEHATRKFEALEHVIAERLLILAGTSATPGQGQQGAAKKTSSMAQNIWRGVQIGGVGVVAGTLLAVTGGLAAPGIAAGLAALGGSAVAGTFLTLASSAAVISLFGVAGGSLAAYKMNRRVSGLSEFEIRQELVVGDNDNNNTTPQQQTDNKKKPPQKAELYRTIAISGWLQDEYDFQRPWGIAPSHPPLSDPVEKLQRFYQQHDPQRIPQAKEIVEKKYENNLPKLWKDLRVKYGCDPDSIFAKADKVVQGKLSKDEETQLDQIIVAIGKLESEKKNEKETKKDRKSTGGSNGNDDDDGGKPQTKSKRFSLSNMKRSRGKSSKILSTKDNNTIPQDETQESSTVITPKKTIDLALEAKAFGAKIENNNEETAGGAGEPFSPPANLATVWNYESRYGGELYTIRWESSLLMTICNSVREMLVELATKAGQEALKHTVAATLIAAAFVPMTIMSVMGSIDGTWTLVVHRADEAGKELALSLLLNRGGHRPVTLVGYSFGARVVYFSCLKQLAKYQEQWEEYHEKLAKSSKGEGAVPEPLEFDQEPASIVEDAVLLGLPKYLNLTGWKSCREVVAGRLVNVYSRNDRILSLLFKYQQMLESLKMQPVVGTCTVAVPGVENIDVTDIVNSHPDYCVMTGMILKRVRQGQPVRSSASAVDEVALMEEAVELEKKTNSKHNNNNNNNPQDHQPMAK